jgi:hypothetical protein
VVRQLVRQLVRPDVHHGMRTFKDGFSSTSPFHPGFACSGSSTAYLAGASGSARQKIQMTLSATTHKLPYKAV